jgi:uncharacterized SAM-binding protein YcdF (DUF218 family)
MLLLSQAFWALAAPGNFLVLLLILGALMLALTRRRRGLGLVAIATAALLVITVLPVGDWLLLPLENRFPIPAEMPERVDGIVVLGGATDEIVSTARNRVAFNAAGARMTDAVALARRYPSAKIVLAGGSNFLATDVVPEAEVMKTFFVSEGIDPARILLEARSRTTVENARFSLAVAQPKPGETWLLVTSAFHLPRAVGSFRGAGWSVLPYPVDFRTTGRASLKSELSLSGELTRVNLASKEWMGLVIYHLLGRTDALFPG